MSRIRIVVADQAEAVFYDAPSLTARPTQIAHLTDPQAHLHDREFSSDRPGRSYESVGGARHAIERENDPRSREALRFAKRIARRLDDARRRDEYEELIVVAGPPFLGLVRTALSRPTRQRVVHEIHKDLVHSPVEVLRRHLPESAAEMRPMPV
jgi:protein required for attachment to host cells